MYTTVTNIPQPVDVKMQRQLLRNAKARCPYFVGSTPASIAHHEGTFTAKWRRINNLTPVEAPLIPLTGSPSFPTRTAVQPTTQDYTATVAKYGNYIVLNEEVDLINPKAQDMKLAEVLGINAGQSLNRLQRNVIEDNATVIYPAGTTADAQVNTKISLGQIQRATNELDRESAMTFTAATTGSNKEATSPIRASYWGICHSDVEKDIRQLTGFIGAEKYASQTQVAEGEFGTVEGVRFITTPEGSIDTDLGNTGGVGVRETTNSKADLYHVPIFGMDAIGSLGLSRKHLKKIYKAGDRMPAVEMISHARGSSGAADALNEISTMGWKSYHAALLLNDAWIRTIRCAASVLG